MNKYLFDDYKVRLYFSAIQIMLFELVSMIVDEDSFSNSITSRVRKSFFAFFSVF